MSHRALLGAACIEVARDPQANLRQLEELIRHAGQSGVKLLVLPECAVQGYPSDLGPENPDEFEYHLRNAESIPGPATVALAKVALEASVEVVVGLTESPREDGSAGRLFNAAVLLSGNAVAAHYRKVHTGAVEKLLWNRGQEWVVTDTIVGKAGLLICYDMVFPEAARALALAGAELLLMPTAWPRDLSKAATVARGYDLFTRARALENQVFFVSANLVGGLGAGFHGHSRIVSPKGELLAETLGPGIAMAEVDISEDLLEARTRSWYGQVFLKDREPTMYGALAPPRSSTRDSPVSQVSIEQTPGRGTPPRPPPPQARTSPA